MNKWLSAHGRFDARNCKIHSNNRNHFACGMCYITAIAVCLNAPDADPVNILKKICDHAKENSKYYSVFLDGGAKNFLRLIEEVEQCDQFLEVLDHFEAVVRITANALQKSIVVVNEKSQTLLHGDTDKPITSETLVILKCDRSFSYTGTQLGKSLLLGFFF